MKTTKPVKKEYFVGIKNSNDLRRNLLESSKSVIMSLENFERIKQIEIEKAELKNKLKNDVKEIKMLFSKLENLMPEEVVQGISKKENKIEKPVQNKQISKRTPKNDFEEKEIQKLHKHLSMIEERLSKLK